MVIKYIDNFHAAQTWDQTDSPHSSPPPGLAEKSVLTEQPPPHLQRHLTPHGHHVALQSDMDGHHPAAASDASVPSALPFQTVSRSFVRSLNAKAEEDDDELLGDVNCPHHLRHEKC